MELAEVLDARKVPAAPGPAQRIIELKNDPEAVLDDLADAVMHDAALSAKILAIANSPAYRRGDPVHSLHRAINIVGFRSVTTIALGLSVASTIPAGGRVAGISMSRFWTRAVLTAGAAQLIANDQRRELTEEAFFVGLVAGLGRVVMGLVQPAEYEALASDHDGWPDPASERFIFGLSSTEVTAGLLRQWGMPELFAAAVERSETISPGRIEGADDADDVARAVALAQEVASFYEEAGHGDQLDTLVRHAAEFAIESDTTDRILDDLFAQIEGLAREFDLGGDRQTYADIVDRARIELVEMSFQTEVDYHVEREKRHSLERTNEDLETQVRHDPLTGLRNRRAFDEQLGQQVSMRIRNPDAMSKSLGMIMMDIDHFKVVNDTHGHDIGDAVLKKIARTLDHTTRAEETLVRLGGEEFVLLLPNATAEEMELAAERLRKLVEQVEVDLPDGGVLMVTASFGVASLDRVTILDDGTRLLKAADEALYEAKETGRNRVVVAADWR